MEELSFCTSGLYLSLSLSPSLSQINQIKSLRNENSLFSQFNRSIINYYYVCIHLIFKFLSLSIETKTDLLSIKEDCTILHRNNK